VSAGPARTIGSEPRTRRPAAAREAEARTPHELRLRRTDGRLDRPDWKGGEGRAERATRGPSRGGMEGRSEDTGEGRGGAGLDTREGE